MSEDNNLSFFLKKYKRENLNKLCDWNEGNNEKWQINDF